MLLRASGERDDRAYDLSAVTDDQGDSGVPHSDTIRALTEAAVGNRWDELAALRDRGTAILGEQAMVDVLTVAAGFNGITRVADATGIPLDDRARAATEDMRAAVGIDRFHYTNKSARYDIATGQVSAYRSASSSSG